MKTIKEKLEAFGLSKALAYMDSDYEKNIPKALDWVEKFDKEGQNASAYRVIRQAINDPENNWNHFIRSIYADLDKNSRRMLLSNFIVNASIVGNRRRRALGEKENCRVPWAILMDPTSACNLRCTGCWAAEYGDRMSLSLEQLDSVITQGKQMGTYFYIYSGGEPTMRKKDIIALCEKHDDCAFLAFTNGTLIDEAFAKEMERVHNFIPAISVEGFEGATDSRRGAGTYRKVIRAMDILKKHRLPFGISVCYTSQNVMDVGGDAFMDDMIKKGAKFCWYFTYIPIGKDAHTELMASDKQREFMYHQVRRFRSEKPIFIMDFWNDGEFVGGCIAGGRSYLHINANGDVEPCAFIHYANANIKDVSLLEALKSPLFAEYRKGQPFNENMLRPCPLLDNPDALSAMVWRAGAHSTDLQNPEDVDVLTGKCRDAAEKWAETSRVIWDNSPAGRKDAPCRRQAGAK